LPHLGQVIPFALSLFFTLSSGQTTMVNALLGIQLLPADTRQPIQRIITVHYTPRKKGSKLKLIEPNGKVATGAT